MQCFEAWSRYWKAFGATGISRARGKSIFNGMDRDMIRARAQAKARGAARATGRARLAKISGPTTLGKTWPESVVEEPRKKLPEGPRSINSPHNPRTTPLHKAAHKGIGSVQDFRNILPDHRLDILAI